MKKETNKKNNKIISKKENHTAFKEKSFIWLKENHRTISAFFIGTLLGFCLITFFIPERIAKLENNQEPVVSVDGFTITADDYYETLKNSITIELLLQDIDQYLLDNLYENTDKIDEAVTNEMESIINEYTSYYGYTEKEFLEENGFNSRDDFYELLLIDYKRNLYYEDYVRSQVSNDEIILYYNNLTPDIEIKYIITENIDIANKILNDLKNNKDYNYIVKTYKNSITYQNMGYVSFDNQEIDENIITEASSLKDNSHSTDYLTLNEGYAIVFRGNSKEKEEIDSLTDRIKDQIKDEIINKDADKNLYYHSLVHLREESNIDFSDTILEKEYNNYIGQYK